MRGRPAPLRERLHHLHAHRQHDAVGRPRWPRPAARSRERYGSDYLPDAAPPYTTKVKNAQEAHEAIRPAGDTLPHARRRGPELRRDELRLYELVWQRTVASPDDRRPGRDACTVRLGRHRVGRPRRRVRGQRHDHHSPGLPAGLRRGLRRPRGRARRPGAASCPPLAEGDPSDRRSLEAKGHETQPPARYTEASLVRRLEELGVGRPSTYASIIATIQDRGYVWKKGSALGARPSPPSPW